MIFFLSFTKLILCRKYYQCKFEVWISYKFETEIDPNIFLTHDFFTISPWEQNNRDD